MEQAVKKQKIDHFPKITDVADYFIHKYKQNGKSMNVLIIQKLCYWAQCNYLAHFKKELFEEDFKHYAKGPCCEDLMNYSDTMRPDNWQELKCAGKKGESSIFVFDKFEYRNPVFEEDQLLIMEFVYETTNDMSTFEMVNKTHDETSRDNPWLTTQPYQTMSKSSFQEYFSQHIYCETRNDWFKYHSLDYQMNSGVRYEISSYDSVKIDKWKSSVHDFNFGGRHAYRWDHQTTQQAHLCSILFPIELEERHDDPVLLFWNPCILKRLQLCADWGNPLAMYYLSTCITIHLGDGNTEIEKCLKEKSTQLLQKTNNFFEIQCKKEQDSSYPFFEMALLACFLGFSNGTEFYRDGAKWDIRCRVRTCENIVELKSLTNQYPPANYELLLLDKQNEVEHLKQIIDRCPYATYELALLQEDVVERIRFLKMACDKGVFSACLPLCDLYFESGKFDDGCKVLEQMGQKGYLIAYSKLGELLESTNMTLAEENYKKNPFLDMMRSSSLREESDENQKQIEEIFTQCLKRLLDVITGGDC